MYFVVMARQAGIYRFTGTLDNLCFYKMDGRYYVRRKSSLSSKKFWKDKAFEGSRKSCKRFGEGNRLASAVFKMVEKEKRTNRLFPFLRTRAIALLKEGRDSEEVKGLLVDYLIDFGFIEIRDKREDQFSLFTFFPDKKSGTNPDSYRDKDSAIALRARPCQRHCDSPIIFSSA